MLRKSVEFVLLISLCMLFGFCSDVFAGSNVNKPKEPVFHREPLLPGQYAMLELGQVKPRGWLKRELEIMRDGITGHMDEFYHLLQGNGWLGEEGPAYHCYQWAPYYCDGLVPLAYLLEDEKLIETAHKWIGWTLDNPHKDGWIGPAAEKCYRSWGMWYPTPMLKAMIQYYEATGDKRVIPVMSKFFKAFNKRMYPPKGRTLLENSDHDITLTYFEKGAGEGLEVHWEGPDFNQKKIPDSALIDLQYEYFEGSWKSLPDFDSLELTDSGDAKNFDIGPIMKKNKRKNNFAVRFTGQIAIRTNGWYDFYLMSDDGSSLSINEREVVTHDGIHPMDRGGLKPGWAYQRWGDIAYAAIWLYDRTGDESLIDLVKLMKEKGRNWSKSFTTFEGMKEAAKHWNHHQHGVNIAMGMKTPGISYLLTKDRFDLDAIDKCFSNLDRYHGTPVGIFTAEECLAGNGPDKGCELCLAVDEMFSLEVLLSVTGDSKLADRLELITYNALPSTIGPRHWTHQYFQRTNQVMCREGGGGFEFGLDTNFPCCTTNMPQSWPKFAANTWMATPDKGLVAVVYSPSEVTAKVAGGQEVTVIEETRYPFDDTIIFTVKTDKPVEFPLYIRIPGWTKGAKVIVAGGKPVSPKSGQYFKINRKWKNGDEVKVVLPMHLELKPQQDNTVAVQRGPLVYSLLIEEDWRKLRDWEDDFEGKTDQCADWELYPKSDWNYALEIDRSNPEKSFKFVSGPIKEYIFDNKQVPVSLKVMGRKLPDWKMTDSSAAIPQKKLKKPLRANLPPKNPKSSEPLEELTLIPYGAARLHISVFPVLWK